MRGRATIAFLVLGLGVGWITGLSMSPVVAPVLGTVLGVASAVVAAAAGVNVRDREVIPKQVDPWPLVFLVVGLSLGAPMGVVVREHGWLGSRANARTASMPKEPADTTSPVEPQTVAAAGLYALPSGSDCHKLKTYQGVETPYGFKSSTNRLLRIIGNHVADVVVLDSLRVELCGKAAT